MPKKGMPLSASIICHDWEDQGQKLQLPCGTFKIDEVEITGPPDKIQIKAVSSELTGPLRDTKKTRAFENVSLSQIASQIASENGLEFQDYSDFNEQFQRKDQRNESDLSFLNSLASENGLNLKAHDGKLILFAAEQAENASPGITIPKMGSMYSPKSYSFKVSSSKTKYQKAEAAYTDPKTGTCHIASATAASPQADPPAAQPQPVSPQPAEASEKTLTLQQRTENAAQAIRLAKSALNKANANELGASLECMGNPALCAGTTLELSGFGNFSGLWYIKKATHKVSGSGGYSTSLELAGPTKAIEGKAHDQVNEASSKFHAQKLPPKGESASPQDVLDWLAQEVARRGSEIDKLILCLPEIAAAMAEKAQSFADRQGWLYLHEMFLKWLRGEANSNADYCSAPVWIDWNWVISFQRIREDYAAFTAHPPSGISLGPNVANGAALQSLGRILEREGYLKNYTTSFNFIDSPWQRWETLYHTHMPVNSWPPLFTDPDGLHVALNKFTLRALASGQVEHLGNGSHRIHLEKIAVFAHDKFNFEASAQPILDDLRFWSCKQLSFSMLSKDGFIGLNNSNFREFRNSFARGADFLVLSLPHLVETWPGASYVYP